MHIIILYFYLLSFRNLIVGVGTKIDTGNARPGSYGNVDIAGSVNEVRILYIYKLLLPV